MNEPAMRIALVTGGLPFGGSTTFLHHLASGLLSAGVPCEIFSFTHVNAFATEFAVAGVTVHTCDENRLIFEDRLAQTFAALASFKPTVVIANIGREAYEIFRYLPRGVMRVGMIHDRVMQPEQLIPAYRDVLDQVVVVAAHLVEDVRTASPDVPCTYLAHGIPIPAGLAPREPNPTEPLKLIYFGRLLEGKGSRLFPQIVDALHQRRIPFQWTLHGSGEEESYLRQRLAAEAARGEIVFSSPISRARLLALVRRHDIYIHAGDTEGGPLTLLESMALGLVPVCGDIPCLIQELITPENGFRVPRNEPIAYAEIIARLHRDRPLLERLSAAARQTITKHFTVEAMACRYINLMEQHACPSGIVNWPERIQPRPFRNSKNQPLFWPVLKPFRRFAKRFIRL
jgi:glycosyltransferase involved in cell wall biosynthesis